MVNKPELLFSGAAFLVCANNDFSSFQAYFSDSSKLWSWFHETVSWVLEGLQDEKHHHHMLQLSHCRLALPIQMPSSFWKNNCVLADHVLNWVFHVHAALPLQWTSMLWPFWWKWAKLLCLGCGEVVVMQRGCPGWEMRWVTGRWVHLSTTVSIQAMRYYPITPFKNNCILRDLLGASSA